MWLVIAGILLFVSKSCAVHATCADDLRRHYALPDFGTDDYDLRWGGSNDFVGRMSTRMVEIEDETCLEFRVYPLLEDAFPTKVKLGLWPCDGYPPRPRDRWQIHELDTGCSAGVKCPDQMYTLCPSELNVPDCCSHAELCLVIGHKGKHPPTLEEELYWFPNYKKCTKRSIGNRVCGITFNCLPRTADDAVCPLAQLLLGEESDDSECSPD
mmetsp:Transcript_36/g.87  ORF Transcript_36/g.87 Transcript_36/m.87 type:complete len:212 (-) Transcript_36:87-722(-)